MDWMIVDSSFRWNDKARLCRERVDSRELRVEKTPFCEQKGATLRERGVIC